MTGDFSWTLLNGLGHPLFSTYLWLYKIQDKAYLINIYSVYEHILHKIFQHNLSTDKSNVYIFGPFKLVIEQ